MSTRDPTVSFRLPASDLARLDAVCARQTGPDGAPASRSSVLRALVVAGLARGLTTRPEGHHQEDPTP